MQCLKMFFVMFRCGICHCLQILVVEIPGVGRALFIEQRLGSRQRLADLLQEEISPGQAKQRGIASLFCYGM